MTEEEYIEDQAQKVYAAKNEVNGKESIEILYKGNGEVCFYLYTFTNGKVSKTVELQPQSKSRYEELIA